MKKIIFAILYLGIVSLSCKKGKEGDPAKAVLTEIETSTQTFKLFYNDNGQLHKAEHYTIVPGNPDKRLKEIIEFTYHGNQPNGFKTYTAKLSANEPALTSTTQFNYNNAGRIVSSEYTPTGASMPSLLYKWIYSADGKPSGFQSTDYNLSDIKFVYGSPWGSLYEGPPETIDHNFDISYNSTPNYFAGNQSILQLYYAFHFNFVFIADFFSAYYPTESRIEIRYGSGGVSPELPKTITTTQFKYSFSSGLPTKITRLVRSESYYPDGQKSESAHSTSVRFRYTFN